MAKVFGMNGLVQGKRGNDVFVIRKGQQIVRQYNPAPAQSKSEAQVSVRARFKLLTQLAEIFAPVNAMPYRGSVSPRNLFVSKNFAAASFDEGEAAIDLSSVKITSSVVGFPRVILTRQENDVNAHVAYVAGNAEALNYDSVVYVLVAKGGDQKLRIIGSSVSKTNTGGYPVSFTGVSPNAEVFAYAYGLILTSDKARVMYGEIFSPTAEQIAKLITRRTLGVLDYIVTETQAAYLQAANSQAANLQAENLQSESLNDDSSSKKKTAKAPAGR